MCKRPGSNNPVLECCVNRNSKLKCKLLCCQSCTFCNKQCKAATKERRKSSFEEQVRNKVCELCFFCRSLCFCPNCSQYPQCCYAPLVGGRLQPFWQTWARLGAHPRVVTILKEGYVLPFRLKPPLVRHPLVVSGYANSYRNLSLKEAVQNLVGKKAIEMVRVRASQLFQQALHSSQTKSEMASSLRPQCSKQIFERKNIQNGNPRDNSVSLHEGEWLSSLDFSDAYFHTQIHTGSRKYLRFHFQNQSFQFQALPFGLSTAPMEFTCVVKEVKLMAQSRGIRIHQYLDDWLIRAPTKESCHQGTQSLCQELGWVVNLQKSEF